MSDVRSTRKKTELNMFFKQLEHKRLIPRFSVSNEVQLPEKYVSPASMLKTRDNATC